MADVNPARQRAEQAAGQHEASLRAGRDAAEQFGLKVGSPVDFSRGIDMSERPRAPAPPPPPAAGTERATHRPDVSFPRPPGPEEGVVGPGAAPEPAPVAPPVDNRAAANARARHKPLHPLLEQLRHEFGVAGDARPTVDVRVADHLWTFCQLTPDMIALAARMADTTSQTAGEHAIRAQHAAVCCSVVAIDGVPLWRVVGLEPGPQDDVSFPLLPRGSLRQRAAITWFAELVDGMKFRLVEALYEAYLAKVDQADGVLGYTAYERVDSVVWVCTDVTCEHRITRPRRHLDDGTEHVPYCEHHGVPMVDVAVTKPRIQEDLDPLG